VDAQMTPDRLPADRADNLFQPVSGDFGAHGQFNTVGKRIRESAWTPSMPSLALGGGVLA
jgi:hypothetical protein